MSKSKRQSLFLDRLKEPNAFFNSIISDPVTFLRHSDPPSHPNLSTLQDILKTIQAHNFPKASIIDLLLSRLETVITNVSDSILIADSSGTVIYQNHHHCWQWIIPQKKQNFILRDQKRNIIPADQWPFDRLLRGEQFQDLELSCEDLQGNTCFTGIYRSFIINDNSEASAFSVLIVKDITNYRKNLKEQHDLLRKLTAIFDHIDQGLIVCDKSGKILEMNPTALKIHGLDEFNKDLNSNTSASPDFEFFTTDHHVLDEDHYPLKRVINQEKFNDVEFLVRDKKTGHQWIGSYSGIPVYDDNGDFILGILTVSDVTKKHTVSRELKQNEEMLQLSLEAGKMFAFECDILNRKIYRSKNSDQILGLSEFSEHQDPDIFIENIHPEDRHGYHKILDQLNPLEHAYSTAFRFIRPDSKEQRWIEERGQGFFDQQGKLIKIIGVILDHTQQKEKEERIKCRERRVHQELAEVEELYNSAHIGLCHFDTNLNYVRINKYLAELNGFSVAAHIGKNIADILPQFAREAREIVSKILCTGKPVLDLELKGSTNAFPDTIHYWKEHWRPISDSSGNILGINVVVEDVTQEKLLNEKLEKHSVILDRMSEGVSMLDTEGYIQYTNPAFDTMYGYESQELAGKHVTILNSYSPKKNMEIIETMMKSLEKTGRWEGEYINRRKDGTEFMTRVRSSGLTINDERFYISVQEDITQFHKLQHLLQDSKKDLEYQVIQRTQELQQTNEILEQIFSSTGLMIAYLNTDFNFITVNKSYANTIQQSPDFFIGKNLFDLFPANKDKKIFDRVIQTGSVFTAYSRPFRNADHPELETTYWDMTLQPVKNATGHVESLILIFINVTDRKKMELELNNTQRKLNEAKRLSDIGILASTVAHELRNPLAAINMALANIKNKTSGFESIEPQIRTIEKKTSESDQIINNLLFYSRIKVPHRENLDVMTVLDECLDFVQRQQQKNVNVTINRIPAMPIIINADPTQMKEVFCNILNNAFDAVAGFTGKVDINLILENGFLKITVCDNGSGIDPVNLLKVSEPFFTTKAKGTGLGLSVCAQIINLHHGDLTIDSQPGQGTTVTISLPTTIKKAESDHNENSINY